jgi:uncharacterized protein involved in exopolysaccharide biosynthesis
VNGHAPPTWTDGLHDATLRELPPPPDASTNSATSTDQHPPARALEPPRRSIGSTEDGPKAPTTWALLLLAVAVVVVCAATAWSVSARTTMVYAADAELLVPVRADGEPQDIERELATQTVVIDGPGVLQPAAEELGMAPDDLDDAISTSVVEGSQIIRVRARGANGDEAVRRLEEVLRAYTSVDVSSSQTEAHRFIDDQVRTVNDEQARLQQELDAVRRLPAPGDPARDRELTEQMQVRTQRLTTLQDQLLQIELQNLQSNAARVISPPTAKDQPIEPMPVRSAALGALAGLVLAAGLLAVGRWLTGGRAR